MLSYSVFTLVFFALVSYFFPEIFDNPVETPINRVRNVYDFIIVGAGSAGCVLARRLSEVHSWNILLVEAGGDETDESKTPLFYRFQKNTSLSWNYTTIKQHKACLVVGGFCDYPRGHAMGGSSSINAMLYVRGNKQDYEEWEQDGATGWNYKSVLPYFLKSENIKIPDLYGSSYHHQDGLLSVQYARFERNITSDIIRAGEEIGLINRDYNGEHQTSIVRSQLTVNGAIRWSTSSAFLNDFNRPNLSIMKNTKVKKIIINSRTKTASGILLRQNGNSRIVRASKEVILSAGAINSPQLLMLSGIGPKDHLKALNIPLVADLPVGNNLQDHIIISFPFELKNYISLYPSFYFNAENALEFAQNKTGVFTTPGFPNMAFFNTGADINADPPDVQMIFLESIFNSSNIILPTTTVLKPKSVGSVRLNSNNIDDKPLIDPNYFAVEDDLNRAVAGLNITTMIMKTKALSKYAPVISKEYTSSCAEDRSNNNTFFKCIAETYSSTIYHPVGTCKMGSANSSSSVVDPELRVIGIKRLRVIDASIFPSITRGNTNAPTIMVAERASDIIKKYYGLKI